MVEDSLGEIHIGCGDHPLSLQRYRDCKLPRLNRKVGIGSMVCSA